MNIVIDCRVFTKRATGVATYAIDAIKAICKYIPEWHLTLVSPKPFHKSIVGLPLDKVKVIISPMYGNDSIPNEVWFHFHYAKIARKLKADLVWTPRPETPFLSVGKAKRMITVHDVVGKEFAKTMSWKGKYIARPLASRSINRADLIWCNSNYTLGKLGQYYPNRKQKCSVIGDSCSTNFHRIDVSEDTKTEIFSEYGISNGFILFVGTLEPRKNLSFLLKIMPKIYEETGYKLIVVGGSGWKNSSVADIVNSPSYNTEAVSFAKYVEFDRLLELYNLATLYVSTAINEGFGMPQLEAMACGCPVVSPHNSGMIEVVGGRGVTIKGWNEKEWQNTIVDLLLNPIKLDPLKHPDLSEYDWKNIILRVKDYVEKNI